MILLNPYFLDASKYLRAILQDLYAVLRAEIAPEARARIDGVHAYPSRRCTYTLNKQRIFLRMRYDRGEVFPPWVLRHVLLHELGPVRCLPSRTLPTPGDGGGG